MKLNLFLLLLLTGLVSVAVLHTALYKYYLKTTPLNWSNAQNYCRVNYNGLAKFQSDIDWERLNTEASNKGLTTSAWVGLYNDINSWRWSLNELPLKDVGYTCWYPGQPDNYLGQESCASIEFYNQWFDVSCALLKPFICYNANFSGASKFIGITTPMNWSQAQTYCRTHYTDLASALNSSDQNMLVQISNIQGYSWFGLYRDTWKWSDGTIATYIPWAFNEPNNAGGHENCAMFFKGWIYDTSCTNTYNFFCYSTISRRRQIVRLQMKSNGSALDSALLSSIVEQVKQKLEKEGMLENITMTWRVQPDGLIFQKMKNYHVTSICSPSD